VRRLVLERGEPILGVAGLADGVALHLEIDAHGLPDLRFVIDDQDEGPPGRLAGARSLEERLQVTALVTPVPPRRVERRDAAEIGPLPDGALGNAEELRRLSERQPVALAGGRSSGAAWFSGHHRPANLPKHSGSLHLPRLRSDGR